jgi:hypothetical protein
MCLAPPLRSAYYSNFSESNVLGNATTLSQTERCFPGDQIRPQMCHMCWAPCIRKTQRSLYVRQKQHSKSEANGEVSSLACGVKERVHRPIYVRARPALLHQQTFFLATLSAKRRLSKGITSIGMDLVPVCPQNNQKTPPMWFATFGCPYGLKTTNAVAMYRGAAPGKSRKLSSCVQ